MVMPTYAPTDEQRYAVELMSGIGIDQDQMALSLGICKNTLRKHFSQELSVGKVKTITKVSDSLVRQALAGNMTAAIFYLKCKAGWKEPPTIVENTGPNGGPQQHEHSVIRRVIVDPQK